MSKKRTNAKKKVLFSNSRNRDIHFGNGTQHLTDSDPDILYISLHRYEQADFYPNDTDGRADYTGSGSGVGRYFTLGP